MLKRSGCDVEHSMPHWDNFAPIKVRVFFWILRHGNTRTRDFLHRHGAMGAPTCPGTEDAAHLFFTCHRIVGFWDRVCPGTLVISIAEALEALPLLAEQLLHTTLLLLPLGDLEEPQPDGVRLHQSTRRCRRRRDAGALGPLAAPRAAPCRYLAD